MFNGKTSSFYTLGCKRNFSETSTISRQLKERPEVCIGSDLSERSKKLRILSKKLQRAHYQKFIGTTQTALMERENKNRFLFGYTNNYIKVKIPFSPELVQQKLKIKLLSHYENSNVISEISKKICTQL
tara:strand:+ start:94 stop:480 length:387 start_codon:yes stop_codon:yes gene_type:complete